MELTTAIRHILDGEAVLFVGAGFSLGAENLLGKPLKSARQLTTLLADKAGIAAEDREDLTLQDAAEEYIDHFGVGGQELLIQELKKQYKVRAISQAHRQIANAPWTRIYTTNYDDVVEKAYTDLGKSLQSVVLSDDIGDLSLEATACVHFNGYIDRLTPKTLQSELKLTETSYITTSIVDSTWAVLFRQDIRLARAVFFIGYSMSDLDISRLVFASQDLQEKCFFVQGADPDRKTRRRIGNFGTVLDMNAAQFAAELAQEKATYLPRQEIEFVGYSITREKLAERVPSTEPLDKEVFDLLYYGRFDASLVRATHSDEHKYYLFRTQINDIVDDLRNGRTVVVHSNLANGKTLLVEGVKRRALEKGLAVFSVTTRAGDASAEFRAALKSSPKASVFVIENYPDWLEFIQHASMDAANRADVVFLVTARSSVHDTHIDRLSERLPRHELVEYGIDRLNDTDLRWLAEMFDEYGLWAEHATEALESKVRYLKKSGKREFQQILVALFKSPLVATRYESLLQQLNVRNRDYHILTSILVLTVFQHPVTIDTLVDLWGDRILDRSFRRNPAVMEMIDFARGEISLRSSAAAKFILGTVANPNWTVDTLVQMARCANNARQASEDWKVLFRKLMRFAEIQYVLPEKDRRRTLILYYESIKNIDGCRRNPLFWLQYAIACMIYEELDRAGKYFETAYAYAKDAWNFDPFQIDNHYARYLLARAVKDGDPKESMESFRQARETIERQMQTERASNYPFRVAQLYHAFWERFRDDLPPHEQAEVQRAAQEVLNHIAQMTDQRRRELDVKRCQDRLLLVVGLQPG